MGTKLKTHVIKVLRMQDLKDGQIAEVIEGDRYVGIIVQRYGDKGIAIGKTTGYSWSDVEGNTLMVRLLEDGELIEIINNK